MRAAVLLALAACGRGSSAPERAVGPTSAVSPTTLEVQPAADDFVVANVNGQPVYGSCVAAQAAGHGLDARAALDQCVAFELLAQEAERRGLRDDLDVGDAWRRELVRAVIREDLGKLTSFDQLPPAFLASIKFEEQKNLFQRPEIRVSQYVRCKVPKKTPEGAPEDLAARDLCEAIFAELGDDEGVLAPELFEVAERIAKVKGAETPEHPAKPYVVFPEDAKVKKTEKEFHDAIYALPEIGRLHAPVRTRNGWDVILWNDTIPPADVTQEIFHADLRKYFIPWSDGIARGLGVTPWIDEALLATLAEPDEPEPK
jgi:hypothetical protein